MRRRSGEKAFSASRKSHRYCSFSSLLSCPLGHLLTNVLNLPALLCFNNTGLEKPRTGRLSPCRHCRAPTARSMLLPSPFFLQHHSLLASLLPHHFFWVSFSLYLLFKLLFHCRASRYGCVPEHACSCWHGLRCRWGALGSPGSAWATQPTRHTRRWVQTLLTLHTLPGQPALVLNYLLLAPFQTFTSHPDFSGPRPPLQSYFMPPSPWPGCS